MVGFALIVRLPVSKRVSPRQTRICCENRQRPYCRHQHEFILKRLFRPTGFIIVFILCTCNLFAQDGHYWTEQQGTNSAFLNGSVIGSVDDLGAVFYNPARLAQTGTPTLALSGKIYALNSLLIKDGAGDGKDLKQSKFGGAPSMFAGTLNFYFLPNHFFAYSFFIRHQFSTNYFIYKDDVGDLIDIWPGDEMYGGQLGFQKNLTEEWIGLSWAYPVNDTWSVGISNFLTIRNQNEFIGRELQIYSPSDEMAIFEKSHQIGYKTLGILWKLSLAYNTPRLTAGLTITTPKVTLNGNGNTLYRNFYDGPKEIGNSKLKDIYVSDQQLDLNARHKSPLSIGFGTGINLGKSRLHLSGEWFSSIAEYENVAADPFAGQSDRVVYEFKMVEKLNVVFNAGLGYELHASDKYSLFGSFATDFSAVQPEINQYPQNDEISHGSLIKADIYHLGGGILMKTKLLEITTGLTYSFANQLIERPFNFPGNEEDINSDPGESELQLSRWKFILGFSFHLAEDKLEVEFK